MDGERTDSFADAGQQVLGELLQGPDPPVLQREAPSQELKTLGLQLGVLIPLHLVFEQDSNLILLGLILHLERLDLRPRLSTLPVSVPLLLRSLLLSFILVNSFTLWVNAL